MAVVPQRFKKIGIFTDIHFGRRSNSRVHNQDCLDFIDWFCAQLDDSYSHIAFLGDWFESRSAINIETLHFSYQGLQKLNSVGKPVYFCVGNHDLHRRTTREIHSVQMFQELDNFHVIDKPVVEDGLLFSPYLFPEEYPTMVEHNKLWAWLGHFEFKGFVVTGQGHALEHGPVHTNFVGPKRILTGHFHKRQSQDNVHYVGNAFPMDFGDAGDYERGMATYYVPEDKLTFTNWSSCPKYLKTSLSKIMGQDTIKAFLPRMKVKCVIDEELGYQDAQDLRVAMIEQYHLRDFILEEDREAKQGLLEGDNAKVVDGLGDFGSMDDLVIQQLEMAKDDKKAKIDVNLLIEIYKSAVAEVEDKEEE